MKRKLHSHLDQSIPDISAQVVKAPEQQKTFHDNKSWDRQFAVDNSMMVHNYSRGDPWVQVRIIEKSGPVSYKVSVDSTNQLCRRHQEDIHQFSPATILKQCQMTQTVFLLTEMTHLSFHLFLLLIQVNLPVS